MWDTLFQISNHGILPFWILLVVAPRWRGTQVLVHSALVPWLGVVVYALGLFHDYSFDGSSLTSLAGVQAALALPHVALAAWVHYLIFDLFIGAWQVRDAQRRGMHHAWVVPCLFCTLMMGPVGLALYLALRWGLKRETSTIEIAAADTSPEQTDS